MEMQVVSDKDNKLLGRREIIAKAAVSGSTPSRKEVLKAVQSHFAAAEDSIVIDKVEHPFGTKYIKVHLKIYQNAADAKKEPEYKAKRGSGEKKQAEGEKK